MIEPNALDVLTQTARLARDAEARRLAEDLGQARAAEERLQLLEHYRHDYEQRFRERGAAGFEAEAWRNYRHFLVQLDAAIEAQRSELSQRRVAAEARRGTYAVAGRKLRSWETLADRQVAEERRVMDRLEQKVSDEYSALALRRRAMGA